MGMPVYSDLAEEQLKEEAVKTDEVIEVVEVVVEKEEAKEN